MKGVLDRFEEEKAVILIEENKEELIVDRDTLPHESTINTWFTIEEQDRDYIFTIDSETTAEEHQSSADLLAKLRAKSNGSKFKKN